MEGKIHLNLLHVETVESESGLEEKVARDSVCKQGGGGIMYTTQLLVGLLLYSRAQELCES